MNEKQQTAKNINPITCMDYPDPDVIRVEDTYYMISTTMHFFPGGEILSSKDLVNWEHAAYVYDHLDDLPMRHLEGEENIYGRGMWAGTLRYHKGQFYVLFVTLETHSTYLFTSPSIAGKWKRIPIEGFFYDASLLFDEDKVYIVHGNKEVRLTRLKDDLSGAMEGGFDEVIVSDKDNPMLGYEGAHMYHIGDYYYIFFIHSLRDQWKRVEACFRARNVEGPYEGKDILNDDMGYHDQGVAQGGVVEDGKGNWYGILFQDRGAIGRIPVLMPMHFEEGWPHLGENGKIPETFDLPPIQHTITTLYQSDDFCMPESLSEEEKNRLYGTYGLKSAWQFNHEPKLSLVTCKEGKLSITTGKISRCLTDARNILTQRMLYPACEGSVLLDGSLLQDGDTAGLCALQGVYGFIGLRRKEGQLYLVMEHRVAKDPSNSGNKDDHAPGIVEECIPFAGSKVRLKIQANFEGMRDEATFYYEQDGLWKQLGPVHKLYFKLDHFTGCRFGLFVYGEEKIGGTACFAEFHYKNQQY